MSPSGAPLRTVTQVSPFSAVRATRIAEPEGAAGVELVSVRVVRPAPGSAGGGSFENANATTTSTATATIPARAATTKLDSAARRLRLRVGGLESSGSSALAYRELNSS